MAYVPEELPEDCNLLKEIKATERNILITENKLKDYKARNWYAEDCQRYDVELIQYSAKLKEFESQSEEIKQYLKNYSDMKEEHWELDRQLNSILSKKIKDAQIRGVTPNLNTRYILDLEFKVSELKTKLDYIKSNKSKWISFPEEPTEPSRPEWDVIRPHHTLIHNTKMKLDELKSYLGELNKLKDRDQWRKAYQLYAKNNHIDCDIEEDEDLFIKCHQHYKLNNKGSKTLKIGVIVDHNL